MAATVTIGGNGQLFVGEDKTFDCEVIDVNNVPVDLNALGATGVFDVRKTDRSTTALLSKAPAIIGVYNVVRATNTQRWRAVVTSADMNTITAGDYRYSFKIDTSPQTVVARGPFVVEKASAP